MRGGSTNHWKCITGITWLILVGWELDEKHRGGCHGCPGFILPHYLTNSGNFHTIIIPWKIKHIKIGKKKII
jgi:hypothetical protein